VLQGSGETQTKARILRHSMSLPEVVLWRVLRTRPAGLKFRRQHPAGPYVADFYCHEARLIVEIDGKAHNRGDRPMRDVARDMWFSERGLCVLRFAATDVLADLDSVVRGVVAKAESLIPLHQPAAGPPPPAGEDFRVGAA
jgi:very-short-patch-repair endonuclease